MTTSHEKIQFALAILAQQPSIQSETLFDASPINKVNHDLNATNEFVSQEFLSETTYKRYQLPSKSTIGVSLIRHDPKLKAQLSKYHVTKQENIS